jgi:hypothetical protein
MQPRRLSMQDRRLDFSNMPRKDRSEGWGRYTEAPNPETFASGFTTRALGIKDRGENAMRKKEITYLFKFALEFVDEVVDETVVKVLTTQVSVTGSGLDLEDTLLDGQERNIESATTEVEDEDVALTLDLLVETVGNSGRGGLVDDAEDVEASNETGILGRLALRVVEVCGDGNDSVVDSATEVRLSNLAHLGQDHRRDLLGSEGLLLALELNLDDGLATAVDDLEREVLHIGLNLGIVELAANQPLRVEDGVDGVHGDLVLGGISDEALGVGERNEGGGCAVALVVGNNFTPAK